jgi:hypothetical protein
MARSKSALTRAFAEDHRHMTRGFWKLRKALQACDIAAAIDIVREIDRKVGPHIEFEEAIFYPALRPVLGDDYVEQLYQEHRIGRAVLEDILGLSRDEPLPEEQRQDLIDRTTVTLDHAVSCGTLLSHVDRLAPDEQDKVLDQLMQSRERGRLWSELDRREGADLS